MFAVIPDLYSGRSAFFVFIIIVLFSIYFAFYIAEARSSKVVVSNYIQALNIIYEECQQRISTSNLQCTSDQFTASFRGSLCCIRVYVYIAAIACCRRTWKCKDTYFKKKKKKKKKKTSAKLHRRPRVMHKQLRV